MGRVVRERVRPDLKPEFIADRHRKRNDAVPRPAFQRVVEVRQSSPIDGEFVIVKGAAARPAILASQLGMHISIEAVVRLKRRG